MAPDTYVLQAKVLVNKVGFNASTLEAASRAENNSRDFGAEQVILVRDETTKDEVKRVLGKRALILTIFDAKGMEFDDVFLFDFFSTTPSPSTIRHLDSFFASGASSSAGFDTTLHAVSMISPA